jgi:TRAP-type uncharacterized transport system fused permease subunit
VLLPAVFVFADEMMSRGRANPDHVFGTLFVAMGIGVLALSVIRVREDRATLLAHLALSAALLVQGYATIGPVRPDHREPFRLVSMGLLAVYVLWNIWSQLHEQR